MKFPSLDPNPAYQVSSAIMTSFSRPHIAKKILVSKFSTKLHKQIMRQQTASPVPKRASKTLYSSKSWCIFQELHRNFNWVPPEKPGELGQQNAKRLEGSRSCLANAHGFECCGLCSHRILLQPLSFPSIPVQVTLQSVRRQNYVDYQNPCLSMATFFSNSTSTQSWSLWPSACGWTLNSFWLLWTKPNAPTPLRYK